MEVRIKMDKNGAFSVDVTEGMPLFTVIGMLEVAKTMIATGDTNREEETSDTNEDV